LKLDLTKAVAKNEIKQLEPFVQAAHQLLHHKNGAGSEFTGWLDLPDHYPESEEYLQIKEAAKRIRANSDVLIVIGIGGSYMGAKAAIEYLSHTFYNQYVQQTKKSPEIYFVGQNLSGKYLKQLLDMLEDKDVSINVISKSGTTTEPAIAFRIFRKWLEAKYGKAEASKRIYATTDQKKGALRTLAQKEGYQTFVIPDNVGGRFSVLTAVGLLPIAVSGADIDQIIAGARSGYQEYQETAIEKNACYQYAIARNILYNQGKTTELLVNYEPSLHYIGEWWKQLFGESEGKDYKGIFPASVDFTTDLHSMGQYIQAGRRNLFETVLVVDDSGIDIDIEEENEDLDGLNFLAGKTVNYVNQKAFEGTVLAHVDGGVPNIILTIPSLNEFSYGKLIYFFQKACAISGYLLGVNPFDQPGVEKYKRNMFALLGKPGYEELQEQLTKRLKEE